jgi:hypothetical protein
MQCASLHFGLLSREPPSTYNTALDQALKERRCAEIGYNIRLVSFTNAQSVEILQLIRCALCNRCDRMVSPTFRKYHDILHEVMLLSRLRHPNIVQYFGHFFHGHQRHLFIILEFARFGAFLAHTRCLLYLEFHTLNVSLLPRASHSDRPICIEYL